MLGSAAEAVGAMNISDACIYGFVRFGFVAVSVELLAVQPHHLLDCLEDNQTSLFNGNAYRDLARSAAFRPCKT